MANAPAVAVNRAPGAVRDSLLASVIGYAVGVLLIEAIFYSRFAPSFGTLLAPWISNICISVGILAGWMLFVLPLSLFHRPGKWTDRPPAIILGAAVGFAITFFETLPLAGYTGTPPGRFTMREFYIATGVLSAITATTCLLALRRKAARRINPAQAVYFH